MIAPTLERECALWAQGYSVVAGLDEVGRGPLAGPVLAAAVVFPPGQVPIEDLRDSKVMTAGRREKVAVEIRRAATAWSIGAASVREIGFGSAIACGENAGAGWSMRGSSPPTGIVRSGGMSGCVCSSACTAGCSFI